MKALRLWLLAMGLMLLVVPGVQAQEGQIDPASEPAAQVRFVHAVPEGPPVDIYLDGERIVSDMPPGTATSYGLTRPGEKQITVVAAGAPSTTAPLLQEQLTVSTGTSYTFAAAPDQTAGVDGFLYTDDTAISQEGSVRLINLAPNQENTSAVVEESAVTEPLSFGEASSRVMVESQAPVVTVVDNSGAELMSTPPIPLPGGEFYTIFVTGAAQNVEPLIVSYAPTSGGPPSAPTWSETSDTARSAAVSPTRLPETGRATRDMTVPLWLFIDGLLLVVLAIGFGWWWQGYQLQ